MVRPCLLLTLDYELFGNGSGSVESCVVEPTRRFLEVAERHGAGVTLFVEALEFLAMQRARRRGAEAPARDARRVGRQLRAAVERGHDVQLHLHPQWADAHYAEGRWWVRPDRWRLGDLAVETVRDLVSRGRDYLVETVGTACTGYRPTAFRAGGWCVQPSGHVVRALVAEGFCVDSSVAPGLRRAERGEWYDFRAAPTDLAAWAVDRDVCRAESAGGRLLELPIATARVDPILDLREGLAVRLRAEGRLPCGCTGSFGGAAVRGRRRERLLGDLVRLASAGRVMLDVCRLPASALLSVVRTWCRRKGTRHGSVPVVAIGHCKTFGSRASDELDKFLRCAADELSARFGTFETWSSGPGSGPP